MIRIWKRTSAVIHEFYYHILLIFSIFPFAYSNLTCGKRNWVSPETVVSATTRIERSFNLKANGGFPISPYTDGGSWTPCTINSSVAALELDVDAIQSPLPELRVNLNKYEEVDEKKTTQKCSGQYMPEETDDVLANLFANSPSRYVRGH